MLRRWLTALLLLAGMMVSARPAAALSCLPVSEIMPHMEIVVEGEIASNPWVGGMEIKVERYFRGTGPELLRAEFEGLERNDFRMSEIPKKGEKVLVGFRTTERGLLNGMCDLFMRYPDGGGMPADMVQLLGAGAPPDPNAPPMVPATSGMTWLWIAAPAALAVGGLALWRLRR